jgi:hypothetical protein
MKYTVFALALCWSTLLYADNWPREVLSSEGLITMYQPQIDSYSGNSLKARAAVSIMQTGKNEPVFGAIWVNCKVFTDRPTRTVMLEEMEVRRIKFPSGTDADTAEIAAALEEMIPRFDLTFSLDLLLVSVETAQKERESARELEMKPPKIVVMDRPAVLVRIDGDPILIKVAGTSLKRIINTPYFLIQNTVSQRYYLHGGDFWFSSNSIKGRWYKVSNPPRSVTDLYEKMKFDEEIDEDMVDDALFFKTKRVPEIFVSTEPTELISTEGPIRLTPIQGTGLFYASNTPNRLFFENSTQHYFFLASGRWYRANKIDGPWIFMASDRLPIDFKRIPPGSVCDDILAHVAGTIPAKEAIYDSQIPQMAEVDRYQTTQIDYDGDPQFESIENTGMDYAVNTSIAVIRVNEHFYGCDRGVWFHSNSPFGPWGICIDVPGIIYTIPPRCPIYNVRYVRVYTYTPDVVYFGYTTGYTGCYVYGGAVVYGTGYNYHPWHKHSYNARPWTWGFNVHYDPWIGWSISSGWTRPHGWFAHQPEIKHAGWWGPGENHPGYRPVSKPVYRDGYQPAYRPEMADIPVKEMPKDIRRNSGMRRGTTLYDSRGTSIRRPVTSEPVNAGISVTREIPATTSTEVSSITKPAASPLAQPEQSRPTRETTRRTTPVSQPESTGSTGEATRTTPQSAPEASPVLKPTAPVGQQRVSRATSRTGQRIVTQPSTRENNIYAAPDGSILRSTPEGWQQRDQNTWKNATEAPTRQATVRDSEVRQRAAERTANPRTQTSPQPVPKSDTEKDVRRR